MAFCEQEQVLLRQTPLLARLSADDFAQLCATLRDCTLARGKTLLHQGQHGDSLYVLIEGRLSVWAAAGTERPGRLQVLSPGAVVGEMSCVDPAPCSATVVADEDCRLAQLDRTLLSSLERAAPSVAVSLVGALIDLVNERLRHTNQRIEGYLARRGTPLPRSRVQVNGGGQPVSGRTPGRQSSALPGLTATDVDLLASVAPVRRCPEGTVLAEEGQPGDACFVIMEGEVQVLKASPFGERLLATLGRGSVVGQMALVDGSPRTATLRTATAVRAMRLERDLFRRMLSSANPVALRFQKGIAVAGIRQLRMADHRLAGIMARPEFRMRESNVAMPVHPGRPRAATPAREPLGRGGTGEHAAVSARRGGTGEHAAVSARRGGTGEHAAVSARRGGTGEYVAVSARRGGTGEYVAVSARRGGTGEYVAVSAGRGGTGEYAAVSPGQGGTGQVPEAGRAGQASFDSDLPTAFDEPATTPPAQDADEIRRRLTQSAERRAASRPEERTPSGGGSLRRVALLNALGPPPAAPPGAAAPARADSGPQPLAAGRRSTTAQRPVAEARAATPRRATTSRAGGLPRGQQRQAPLRAAQASGEPRDEVEEALTFLHAAVREWGLSLDELDEVQLVDTPGVPRGDEWRGRRGR